MDVGKVIAAGMYWAAEDAALVCGGFECMENEDSAGVQSQKCYMLNPQDGEWRETFPLDVSYCLFNAYYVSINANIISNIFVVAS